MGNGQPRSARWRSLLEDGQDHRVLELVIDELDAFDMRAERRYAELKRRMGWVTTTLVSVLVALIAVSRFA
jgi:hypothetical protein